MSYMYFSPEDHYSNHYFMARCLLTIIVAWMGLFTWFIGNRFELIHSAAQEVPIEENDETESPEKETDDEVTIILEKGTCIFDEAMVISAAAVTLDDTKNEMSKPVEHRTQDIGDTTEIDAGIYFTAKSLARGDNYIQNAIEQIHTVGGTVVVIDVKENEVLFNSAAPLASQYRTIDSHYTLSGAVKRFHDAGLRVIARFVAAKDSALAKAIPSTRLMNPNSGNPASPNWVDPGNKTVLQYNEELLREVIASGVDEVNLDYIRFPTEVHPASLGMTTDEKISRVEDFILMARKVIDEVNPQVKLGISTYAILGWEYDENIERLAQDVTRFAKYVDIISPMAYPASFAKGAYYENRYGRSRMYELVRRTIEGYGKILAPEHHSKLRPWIQGYRADPWELKEEIDAVYDSGLCGYTIWSATNNYWSYFAQDSEKIKQPEWCRK